MEKMLYGANEATTLTQTVADVSIPQTRITFGKGGFDEAKVVAITEKPETDEKIRFVYGAEGGSGLVFAGNKLVSSKILDITTNEEIEPVWDGGVYQGFNVTKPADKVTVKWFGTQVDKADNVEKTQVWTTEFDIVDKVTVAAMIAEAQGDLQDQIDELKEQHIEDTSRLDSSVSGIEDFISSDVITEAEGGAITVTPTADENGYQTYEVAVNVDASTVKVVEDKLAVATYSMSKLGEDDDNYDVNFASQYQLTVTDPETGEVTKIGEPINIMKDFLLKEAHVCTFDSKEDGSKVVWDGDGHMDSYTKDAEVTETTPIYAVLPNGNVEKAPLNHGIKLGRTYLHMVLNTKDNDEVLKENDGTIKDGQSVDESLNYENDQLTDVYLDFTEIFATIHAGDDFIEYNNGAISLNEDKVTEYVDSSLGITDHFEALDASTADQEDRLVAAEAAIENLIVEDASLEAAIEELQEGDASIIERLEAIEESYIKSTTLAEPSEDNDQFNTLKFVDQDGTETSVDVANASFYDALNDALDTLNQNDDYLARLLTWQSLD